MVRTVDIDEKISNIETLVKQTQVMISDLSESYFCEEVMSEIDTWKILSHYYETADVKVGIIADIVSNLSKSLEELKNTVHINADAVEALSQHPKKEHGD